jgi:hypothetical protein
MLQLTKWRSMALCMYWILVFFRKYTRMWYFISMYYKKKAWNPK